MTISCRNLVKVFPESAGLQVARPVIEAVFGRPCGGHDAAGLAVRVDAAKPPVSLVQEVSANLPGVVISLFYLASDGQRGHRSFSGGAERRGYAEALAEAAFTELNTAEAADRSVFREDRDPPATLRVAAEKHLRAGYGFIHEEIAVGYSDRWYSCFDMEAHFKKFEFLKALLREPDQQYLGHLVEAYKQRASRLSARANAARRGAEVLELLRRPEYESVLDAADQDVLRGVERLVAKLRPDFGRELAGDLNSEALKMVSGAGN